MYIMEVENEKVGQIRIDRINDIGEISYMIAPEARGKGYGKKIIALVEDKLRNTETGIKTLTAFTLKDNVASGRCFQVNGYNCEDAGDSYCYSKSII